MQNKMKTTKLFLLYLYAIMLYASIGLLFYVWVFVYVFAQFNVITHATKIIDMINTIESTIDV